MRKTDYSTIAHYYDHARPGPAEIWIKTILELAGVRRDSHVLDVGCGTGRFTVLVRQHHDGPSYGVDRSIEMLKRAVSRQAGLAATADGMTGGGGVGRARGVVTAGGGAGRVPGAPLSRRQVHWVAGDAHSLPLKSRSVDVAYMTMVMHHIERRVTTLREMRRVLKPGGRCLVMTSSHSAIRAHVLRHFPGVVATDLKRFPPIPTLKAEMEKAGFKNVRSRLVTHREEEIPVEKYMNMVRNKYISTFDAMGERKFEMGLRTFEKKLARIYGKTMSRTLAFTFVTGER